MDVEISSIRLFLFILSVVVEDYMEKKVFESLKKIVYTMLS